MGPENILIISLFTIFVFISMLSYSIYRIKRVENALISLKANY